MIQRAVTDEIMYELMRLSGQEYVDEYAAVVKLRLAGKGPEPVHKIEVAEEAAADIAEDRDEPRSEGTGSTAETVTQAAASVTAAVPQPCRGLLLLKGD